MELIFEYATGGVRWWSGWGLGSGDLDVGNDIRVAAFLVARIHSSCGVAVGRAVYYHGVRVQRTRIQRGVDLRE